MALQAVRLRQGRMPQFGFFRPGRAFVRTPPMPHIPPNRRGNHVLQPGSKDRLNESRPQNGHMTRAACRRPESWPHPFGLTCTIRN